MDRPRNQGLELLERPGRITDLPEVVFVVVLVTIGDSVRGSEEMTAAIESAVARSGGVDRTARVINLTGTVRTKGGRTARFRATNETRQDQNEKCKDPAHRSNDSHA
ncbi:MAG: hypothetical protein ACLP7Q_00805 [Isosphaeraceae bacterium]